MDYNVVYFDSSSSRCTSKLLLPVPFYLSTLLPSSSLASNENNIVHDIGLFLQENN